MDNLEIVLGVQIDPEHYEARFQRGNLTGLATAVRDALWQQPLLFDLAEPLHVYVGGNHHNSEEPSLEVKGQTDQYLETLKVSPRLKDKLEKARSENLPSKQYAYWDCDCAEYCDQNHGEGRLEFEVRKPTFRELFATQAGGATRKHSTRKAQNSKSKP
jgi:hypothetical protein